MEKKRYLSRIKATERWKKENEKQIKFVLYKKTDADIIAKLESVPNRRGYLKELIRADIAKSEEG